MEIVMRRISVLVRHRTPHAVVAVVAVGEVVANNRPASTRVVCFLLELEKRILLPINDIRT